MKKIALISPACLCLLSTLSAQIGKVGINTTEPAAMLHVKDSSVLFTGTMPPPVTIGEPPASGPGVRMMWYANKAAFRVGHVNSDHWDKANVGSHSFAAGFNTKASGQYSTALGLLSTSSGVSSIALGYDAYAAGPYALSFGVSTDALTQYSVAIGRQSTASGYGALAIGYNNYASEDYTMAIGSNTDATADFALALGYGTLASGIYSTAMGFTTTASHLYATAIGNTTWAEGFASTATGSSTRASGAHAFAGGFQSHAKGTHSIAFGNASLAAGHSSAAIGQQVIANGYASISVGMYNDTIIGAQAMVTETTPLFIVGNGNSTTDLSNALVVRKDGHIGIGTNNPLAPLHVQGNTRMSGHLTVDSLAGFGLRYVVVSNSGRLETITPRSAHCIFENLSLPTMSAPAMVASESLYLEPGVYTLMFSGTAFRMTIGLMRYKVTFSLNGELIHTALTDMTANHEITHLAFPAVFSMMSLPEAGIYDIEVFLVGDGGFDAEVDYNDRINLMLIPQ